MFDHPCLVMVGVNTQIFTLFFARHTIKTRRGAIHARARHAMVRERVVGGSAVHIGPPAGNK